MPSLHPTLLLLGVILTLFMFWKPLTLFILPGVLLLYTAEWENEPALRVLSMLGASLCFWIVSFWTLKWLPVSLTQLYYITLAGTLAAAFLLHFGLKKSPVVSVSTADCSIAVLFLAAAVLRFIPMSYSIVPAGADMSMHTYISVLIAMANGIPSSYEPLLNLSSFDTFPVGFHVISALTSLLGKIEPYRATFLLSCATYTLLSCALYCLLVYFVDWKTALAASLWLSFVTSNPQGFVGWGGNPTVLALVLVIFFVSSFLRMGSYRSVATFLAALFLAGSFLTHTIIFIQAFYILSLSFLFHALASRKLTRRYVHAVTATVACFLVLVSPYLYTINTQVLTEPTLQWIREWVTNPGHAGKWSPSNFYFAIPKYIYRELLPTGTVGFLSLLPAVYGAVILRRESRVDFLLFLTFLGVSTVLVWNTRYWLLPFSYAIYPERVAAMCMIPLAVFFASGISKIKEHVQRQASAGSKQFSVLIAAGIIVLLVIGGRTYKKTYLRRITSASSVTAADLQGFKWLEKHTAPGTIIANNYGDGGLWIPAIIKRQATDPHINVVFLDKIVKTDEQPRFVFVGSKCVYQDACPHRAADLASDERYEVVFHSANTWIFQLKQ